MRFVTVATQPNPHLDRLLQSAKYHGIHLEVLGQGAPYPSHRTKIDLMLAFLERLPPDEEILFLDAYDSVFLCGPDEIVRKYHESGASFLCSAEQNLKVSDGFRKRLRTWRSYPAYPKPYRFANSGTYVGRVEALRAVWGAQDLDRIGHLDCDQTALNTYHARHPEALVLDAQQRIFAVTAGRTGLEASDYAVEDGRLRSRVTGERPCVLHCPGKNYVGLEQLIRPLPWSKGGYEPRREDWRGRFKTTLLNRATARTTQDNFLFHMLLNGSIGLAIAALILVFAGRL